MADFTGTRRVRLNAAFAVFAGPHAPTRYKRMSQPRVCTGIRHRESRVIERIYSVRACFVCRDGCEFVVPPDALCSCAGTERACGVSTSPRSGVPALPRYSCGEGSTMSFAEGSERWELGSAHNAALAAVAAIRGGGWSPLGTTL